MKIILRVFYWLIVFVLLFFAGFVTFSVFSGPGNLRFLTVQSGSMEPTLKIGSVILVLPKKQNVISPVDFSYPRYQKGEIISFLSGKETITHRIVKVEKKGGKFFYKTKGDANQGEDVEEISEDKILGKVVFTCPLLGYFISFAKTQMGFIAFIVIPATLIVYSEILTIKEEIKKMFFKRNILET